MLNGIICIDKPEGFTSFDVIAKMRGILKIKKLGHSGTLDPMATGVLPVFAGNAPKAISIIPQTEKGYRAGFKLGMETDTYDITGKTIDEKSFNISLNELEDILKKFRGKVSQTPPMYSAVKVEGKRLYDLARRGIEVERPVREVKISKIDLVSFDETSGEGILDIICSKGTYIRSLIQDMGKAADCGAVMTSLVRTLSNGFTLEDCVTLNGLENFLREKGNIQDIIIPVEKLFLGFPEIRLSEKKTKMYKNGVKLMLNRLDISEAHENFRVYGYDGEFIGIARTDKKENLLRVLKNLNNGDNK